MRYSLFISFFLLREISAYGHFFQNEIQCQTDEECQHIIEGSECINTCKCSDKKLLSSDGSKCLEWVNGFGDACEDNIQCSKILSTGGVCINNKCKCKADFHYLKGKCWKNVDLEERCLKNEQCFSAYEYVGLQCESGKCRCRPQYYKRLYSGCRRIMNISDECNLDTDCPDGVNCTNMKCLTSREKVNVRNSERIRLSLFTVELGDVCKSDGYCKEINHAICLDNRVCACKPPKYVASEDNKQCLPTSRGKVQDIQKSSCKENAQCAVFGGNSICEDKKCICKNGTYWDVNSQFCWTIKHVGEKCMVAEDCHPNETFAECKEQVCVCQKGYHKNGMTCARDATEVGDYCDKDQECLFPNSFCKENACACKENYYEMNGKCLAGVNSICKTDADCYHLNNTRCRSRNFPFGQCLCLENHLASDQGNYCLPVVNFGGQCEETFQCRPHLGKLGECGNGVCQCQNKTHYFYGKCYESKFVKESCTRLQDCHPGNDVNSVICLRGFCSCNYGYELGGLGLCVKTNSAAGMMPCLCVILAALFSLY